VQHTTNVVGIHNNHFENSSEPYYRNMFRLIVPYIGIDEKNKTVSALCCYETANKAFKLIFTPYNGTNLGIALPSA
jgi:hypothetical protein